MFEEKIKLADLKPGDMFHFGKINCEPLVWLFGEKDHKDYPPDSALIVPVGTIGNITFAPANPLDKIHDRRLYGSNRYADSYVESLINDDDFISSIFSEEEAAAILKTSVKTIIPNIDGVGIDTIGARLFLLSASEVGLAEEDEEGSVIELFKNGGYRKARDIDGDWDWWWLRSAVVSGSYYVRLVNTDGTLGNGNAYLGYIGLRPACNLKSDYLVSVVGGQG